ncbi:leucyl/phenylalanyl-tRNA--protein transferase [Aquabacterium soli]|uniref:Leucyl/phenylalanyl-tRNA--protein transferase n=1 Tax=Aquabacterium soli TaxID=2493092 RepID=A0A3R8S8K6_9BURK|nr:leucyl/phenylalanyl-tRNA--protein transferase [Aquabacterium soli]RRS04035.1 leucyl/phenylalanyl-tRNA--protein transferase [Aquabacterium soli]
MIDWLQAHTPFPDTHRALGPDTDAPGLLAAGGELSIERLQAAYRRGIFPWFGPGQPVMWWSPAPRMVLPVSQFKLSRSLRKTIARFRRTPDTELRIDHDFPAVIRACADKPREGQDGTWIVPPIQEAYAHWHRAGQVHSFETWIDGELVGGLYGVNVGRMFFGESMFAHRTDASKIALAALVCFCRANGIDVIDCQQQTEHLASLGAVPWSRERFEAHLKQVVDQPRPAVWAYDDSLWALLAQASSSSPEPFES